MVAKSTLRRQVKQIKQKTSSPLSSPAEIGATLQHDIDTTAAKLSQDQIQYTTKRNKASTLLEQKLAAQALDRLHALGPEPYFGWLRLREGGIEKTFRVGKAHYPDAYIVSWTHELAKLLYDADPGDDYERAGGAAMIDGELLAKARLTTTIDASLSLLKRAHWEERGRNLHIVRLPNGEFADEQEVLHAQAERAIKEVMSTGGLSEIFAYITREQYRLIAHAHDKPLIIQGKAGSGKTTVAMHRLAWLARPLSDADTDAGAPTERQPINPSKILIVMFNKALESFVRTMCAPLGLEAAELKTFHSWSKTVIQRFYKGNFQITQQPPYKGRAEARRIKAHDGMLNATTAYVESQSKRVEEWLKEKLRFAPDWLATYQVTEGPPLRRLTKMRAEISQALSAAKSRRASSIQLNKLDKVHEVFQQAITKMRLFKEDLFRLLTDKTLLSAHIHDATASDLELLAQYQAALQGGSATKLGSEIDFDDLALMMRLMQLKMGGLPLDQETTFQYEHVMIDEAQDFGAVPLRVLLDSVHSRTGVTIVGDVNQKILHNVAFIGWDGVASALGLGAGQVAHLTVGHRSSIPIMQLTDWLVGIAEESSASPHIDLPTDEALDTEGEALERLRKHLTARHQDAPNAHICVVCESPSGAEVLEAALRQLGLGEQLPLRRGHNRAFEFAPGVTITNRQQVKGLEFDTVIVWDPSDQSYPDTAQGRRDLYVVTSRAQTLLRFIRYGHAPCALLSGLADAGLVEVSDLRLPDLSQEDLDEPF